MNLEKLAAVDPEINAAIGEELGTGAYCSQLRRTRIADWDIAAAQTLQEFGITD